MCLHLPQRPHPPPLLALWTDPWPEGSQSKLERRREGRKRKEEVKKREGGSEAMIWEGKSETPRMGGTEKGSP